MEQCCNSKTSKFQPKNSGRVLKKKKKHVQNHINCREEMFPSTVKIYVENEGGVSRVITVMVQLLEKTMITMKIVIANPIMIMTMATSVTVIFCNQNAIAGNDGSQQWHPIKLILFIQQQPRSGVVENEISKICS